MSPATAERVHRRDREAGRRGGPGNVVDADERPPERAAAVQGRLELSPAARARLTPGAAVSATTRPPGASTSWARLEQRDRVAADADVAVGEQRGTASDPRRARVEDVASAGRRRAPGFAGRPPGRRRSRGRPGRAGQGLGEPPGAAPDVDGGPVTELEQSQVGRSAGRVHWSTGSTSGSPSRPTTTMGARQRPGEDVVKDASTVIAASPGGQACAKRVPGTLTCDVRASVTVSTSVSWPGEGDAVAGPLERRPVSTPWWRWTSRTSASTSATAGSRRARAHQPPSGAGPRTASCPASAAAAERGRRASPAACPCRSGPPTPSRRRRGRDEPGGEAVATLVDDGPPGEDPRRARCRAAASARSPARRRWPAAPTPRRPPGCRAAPPPRGRPRRSWPTSAPRRVLTCPGTGALAITSTVNARHEQHPPEVARGRGGCRAPTPTPWSGCRRHAGGRRRRAR